MCGIIYSKSFRNQPVNRQIVEQFQKQRRRGIEGFGVYDNQFKHMVRSPSEDEILKWLKTKPSTEILFHHRTPTSTENVYNACHPFSTKDFFKTQYILVHNGWINNADELREAHEKLGIKYISVQPDGTFNDSEALLWDFALYMEGKQDKLEARGYVAFICIAKKPKGEDKLFFYRNFQPLNMLRSNKKIFLSSEGPGQAIEAFKLHTFDYATKKIVVANMDLPSWVQSSTWKENYQSEWDRDHQFGWPEHDTWDRRGSAMIDTEGHLLLAGDHLLQEEVDEVFDEYLELADGNFARMSLLLEDDIEAHQIRIEVEEDYDELTTQELRLLNRVLSKLLVTPMWTGGPNEIHPRYRRIHDVN